MAAEKKASTPRTKQVSEQPKPPRGWTRPFRAFGGYFKGSWVELRQVRWPDRKATWSLTFAVIVFSLFFALVIVGLDAAFSYLFKEVLL